MTKTSLLVLALVAWAGAASATVTLQFRQIGVANATGFANNAGTVTNGMRWGIIVDTQSNGFQGGSYDGFNIDTNGFLTTNSGGTVTDDYYFATNPTSLVTASQTATGTDSAANGGITATGALTITGITNLNTGDAFQIVWFDGTTSGVAANGTFYGMLGNTGATATFTVPADGATQSYAAFFVGDDPAKPASFTFGGTTVPEPGMASLSLLGFAGLFLRRRR